MRLRYQRYWLYYVGALKCIFDYNKLHRTFSEFYRRYCDLVSGFQVGLGSLLGQGLLEPEFYIDLVYGLGKIVSTDGFSGRFIGVVSHCGGGGLADALVCCSRLHGWWSAQSHLAALLYSMVSCWYIRLRALWWFCHGELSVGGVVGPIALAIVGPASITCWISFAPVFSFIYC